MIMNRNSGNTSRPLRALVRAILFIACGVAVVAAIVFAQDVDQAGSAFLNTMAGKSVDVLRMARHRLRCRVHPAGTK